MASQTISVAGELRRIVDDFKTKVGFKPEELKLMDVKSVDDLTSVIDAMQRDHRISKNQQYLQRLEPYIGAMVQFGNVIGVFLNASEILCFVWGPLKFLLLLTESLPAAYNGLLETYQQIAEEMPLLQEYSSLINESTYMQKGLIMVYSDIIEFHIHALKFFRGRVWKQLFQSFWPKIKIERDRLVDNLRRHKQFIQSGASLLHFQLDRQQFEKLFIQLKEDRDRAQDSHDLALDNKQRQQRYYVFTCLESPANIRTHEAHITARSWSSSTCQWILKDKRINSWLDSVCCQDPLLWMHGKPGAGKSVVASLIIEEAKLRNGWSTAFFYFSHNQTENNDFLSMAKAILEQLVSTNDELLDYLDSELESSGWMINSMKLAKDLLSTALRSRRTFVVLDGLDECKRDVRKRISDWFKTLITDLPRSQRDDIRCLFISQDDGLARKDMTAVPRLEIQHSSNEADIEAFVRHRQKQIQETLGSNGITRGTGAQVLDVAHIIKVRANGMFIFARCVLEEMEQCSTMQELQDSWSSTKLPEDINDVYKRIYDRLTISASQSRRRHTQTLLSWIALAQRPIRWFELQAMISLNSENETVNEADRRLLHGPKDFCASFIEMRSDGTVELVHSTARKYLVALISTASVHQDLCIRSVQYLNFGVFRAAAEQDSESDEDFDAEIQSAFLQGQFSLHDYTVACWIPHLLRWTTEHGRKALEQSTSTETLEIFCEQHIDLAGGSNPNKPKAASKKSLECFQKFEFHEALTQVVAWFEGTQGRPLADDDEDPIDIPRITKNIRSSIEKVTLSSLSKEARELVDEFYGKKLFKCSNSYCRHFWDGFETAQARDDHNLYHERPFNCPYLHCPYYIFGFTSKSLLETHVVQEHGVVASKGQLDFPDMSDPNRNPWEKQLGGGFECKHCPKTFASSTNLLSHTRTHTKLRPFVCRECRKKFKMPGDLVRHMEGGSHRKKADYMCLGVLKNGDAWGCGRDFSSARERSDHLKNSCGDAMRAEDAAEEKAFLEREKQQHLLQEAEPLGVSRTSDNEDQSGAPQSDQ